MDNRLDTRTSMGDTSLADSSASSITQEDTSAVSTTSCSECDVGDESPSVYSQNEGAGSTETRMCSNSQGRNAVGVVKDNVRPLVLLVTVALFAVGMVGCCVLVVLLRRPTSCSCSEDPRSVFVLKYNDDRNNQTVSSFAVVDETSFSDNVVNFGQQDHYGVIYNPLWIDEEENEYIVKGECECCEEDYERRGTRRFAEVCTIPIVLSVLVIAVSMYSATQISNNHLMSKCKDTCSSNQVARVKDKGATEVKKTRGFDCTGRCFFYHIDPHTRKKNEIANCEGKTFKATVFSAWYPQAYDEFAMILEGMCTGVGPFCKAWAADSKCILQT